MNNQTRYQLLDALLTFDQPLSDILNSLNQLSWDREKVLINLKKTHIINILQRYLQGQLSVTDVENWANAIEGREDIEPEENDQDILEEILFDLANPLLSQPLSPESVKDYLTQLNSPIYV
jgi:ArsR family metal-binding transcriptional regulator